MISRGGKEDAGSVGSSSSFSLDSPPTSSEMSCMRWPPGRVGRWSCSVTGKVVGRTRCREEGALHLAFGAFPALDRTQHTPQPLHGAEPSGGSAARGKGGGGADGRGAGAEHRVLSTNPRTNRVMVESYVCLSMRAGHVEDELMEQEGAAEEGEAPLSGVLPPPQEVEYEHVQRGPATLGGFEGWGRWGRDGKVRCAAAWPVARAGRGEGRGRCRVRDCWMDRSFCLAAARVPVRGRGQAKGGVVRDALPLSRSRLQSYA
jgi:hypothetical protein